MAERRPQVYLDDDEESARAFARRERAGKRRVRVHKRYVRVEGIRVPVWVIVVGGTAERANT